VESCHVGWPRSGLGAGGVKGSDGVARLARIEDDLPHADRDDLLWADCSVPAGELKFFVVSPYLNPRSNACFGRLVYVTRPPFGGESIRKLSCGRTWYKVIHRVRGGARRSVGYDDILGIAAQYGFLPGQGVHRQLSCLPTSAIHGLHPSPRAVDVYPQYRDCILRDVAAFYALDVDAIRLTGSAAAFSPPYSDLSDIDVVVPIRDFQQLGMILRTPRTAPAFTVPLASATGRAFGHPYSSLRWHHPSGAVVCPFFVFAALPPPVAEARDTGTRVRGRVTITDARYGIFNTQYYECSGVADRLMICSTFGRGETDAGTRFNIDCPLYQVTRGAWVGMTVAIANSPYLGLTERHLVGV